jgi:7,8-dihydroneopterin aldolase/epimerase/oxygenase
MTKISSSGLWDAERDYVRILLDGIRTEARVGLHPWERFADKPNPLLVSIELFAPSPRPETTAEFMDYDPLRAAVKEWPNRPHTELLETLAEELVSLCFTLPRVAACRVSVLKTGIFNEINAVGVELYRRRPVAP